MSYYTGDLVSDITDCYGNTVAEKSDEIITDNDETCSEIDTVANDINTLVNAPKTQESMLTIICVPMYVYLSYKAFLCVVGA